MGNEDVSITIGMDGEEPPVDTPPEVDTPPADPPKPPEADVLEVTPEDSTGDEPSDEDYEWPDTVPEWAQAKYKDVDAYLKGIESMNSENGKMARELAELKKGKEGDPSAEVQPGADITSLIDDLSESYQENQQLTEADYDKLAKAGIPKEVATQFLAGTEALIQQQRGQLFAAAGGEAEYGEMMKWANDNLSAPEQDAYNRLVLGADAAAAAMAAAGVAAQWRSATGKTSEGAESPIKRRLQGRQAKGALPFKSEDEMSTAINDKRYGTDTAYTADVQARIVKSDL